MSSQAKVPEATQLAQAKASNPRGSAWVGANAGSGKTFVLTRRVLRLLLDGQDPASLLCLTFTKAAAAEMASRVFSELARWTRLDDADLADVLSDLQGRATARDLANARGLFARALETPGGLKIQTIHAFCESLLHQFPLEAGVAASFTVLDDRDADALMQAARAEIIARAARGQDPALTHAFEGMAARFADSSVSDHLDAVLRARHALTRAFDAAGKEGFDARLTHLIDLHAAMLGLDDGDVGTARNALADPIKSSPILPKGRVEAIAQTALDVGTAKDAEKADVLVRAWKESDPDAARALWDEAFLTKQGKPRKVEGSYFAAKVRGSLPDIGLWLKAEQDRVLALQTHVGFADLMRVAHAVLDRFETLKTQRGALDFGDLIARTAALLTRSEAQAWVRYKIDQRIDHILVDEAQDTSAQQWAIIRALADDFFDGEGRRADGITPTFFAVGDDKQSIYSFQGADPRQFDGTRRALETKAVQGGSTFEGRLSLLLSFRSTRDILSAVDTVFSRNEALQGVTRDEGLVHEPYRSDRGQVELWPVIKGKKEPEPEDWTAPIDALPAPHLQLAEAIAGRVKSLVAGGQNPGDILILLRTRGAMADAINKALKARAIAVAGTDRLLLTEHIAVEDMMALMQVVLLPEDDLSLACLLTSPLVGLSDEQVEALCMDRPGLLIDALNAPTNDPAVHQAAQDVRHWRAMADFTSPFTFLSTVLGRDGGRKKMLARLGEDARDPLDELLRLARAEETRPGSGLANLEAFLDTLRRLKLDIKRDMEARADKVRIMTVHGAKGLEAGTVFLVDTCRVPRAPSGIVETVPEEGSSNTAMPPLVLLAGDTHAPAYQEIKEAGKTRQLEEYRRLLYVAMTRARDQLIVTGHMTSEANTPEGSWYDLIDKALGPDARDVGDLEGLADGEPVRVWRADPWPDSLSQAEKEQKSQPSQPDLVPLKALLAKPTPAPKITAPLRPSKAHADIAVDPQTWPQQAQAERHARTIQRLEEGDQTQALLFGTLVHRLLEPSRLLSFDQAETIANALDPEIDPTLITKAFDQATAVHRMDVADSLFGQTSRAEVPLRGSITDADGNRRQISGSIDRLVILPNEVWAIDFKTNAIVPELSRLQADGLHYLAQISLYSALLSRLFADRPLRCGLLWTSAPRLDWVTPSDLRVAEESLNLTISKA
ncbi:MAG: double-strand break repair helicase AddA [Pseudomonadota bacterium]